VEIAKLPEKRKRIVATVNRLSRAACFRQTVLSAYVNRCAVTRMQLRLIDAAHILPVGVEGSTDSVQNGVALSPTYHRAFDNGLIFLDEDFTMRLNPARELHLKTIRLDGGLPDFRKVLDKRIHLPSDRRQWPDLNVIRKANSFRRIQAP
jgi:putative restriction endonuclease